MPEMSVCPVSVLVDTRNDGSSVASLWRDPPSRSWSTFVFGSMAIEMTGSGNCMRSRTIGLLSSQSVSPVVVSRRPTAATMSPA